MNPTEGPGLSLTEWVVLALLSEAPSHGFAVARNLSRVTPLGEVWTVPRPLVYRAIGRLEEQGMVASAGEEPGDPGPTRMVYQATGKGKKAVAQWRATSPRSSSVRGAPESDSPSHAARAAWRRARSALVNIP